MLCNDFLPALPENQNGRKVCYILRMSTWLSNSTVNSASLEHHMETRMHPTCVLQKPISRFGRYSGWHQTRRLGYADDSNEEYQQCFLGPPEK